MQKIGIFYGSTTGNTETSAQRIQQEFGEDIAQLFDVSEATSKDIEQFTNLVFGASTWGIGDLQDDFESFMTEISEANLLGKKLPYLVLEINMPIPIRLLMLLLKFIKI